MSCKTSVTVFDVTLGWLGSPLRSGAGAQCKQTLPVHSLCLQWFQSSACFSFGPDCVPGLCGNTCAGGLILCYKHHPDTRCTWSSRVVVCQQFSGLAACAALSRAALVLSLCARSRLLPVQGWRPAGGCWSQVPGTGRLWAGAPLFFPTSPVLPSQAVGVAVFQEQRESKRQRAFRGSGRNKFANIALSKRVSTEVERAHPRSKDGGLLLTLN